MKLYFLYVSDGAAATGKGPTWNTSAPTNNSYALQFYEEGYCALLRGMVQRGIVDEAVCVIESMRSPGCLEICPGLTVLVMPEINWLESVLEPDDVIFCRHGFRTWFPLLERQHKAGRWQMLYGANGGRERWRVWDIIFNDLAGHDFIDQWDRINLHFRKPINTDIFYYKQRTIEHDIMIGASHIHDKKAQWLGVEVLKEYNKRHGVWLRAIMPGRAYRGEKTNKMLNDITTGRVPVLMPGMVERPLLAEMMRKTAVFLNLGSGQGDRSVLEAIHCGCNTIIGQPQYHDPHICASVTVPQKRAKDVTSIVDACEFCLKSKSADRSEKRAAVIKQMFSLEGYTLPRMSALFDAIRRPPKPGPQSIYDFMRKVSNG